jgi:rRNA-processing protein FCF1
MKIILDTNFLIDCLRFNLDIKSELAGNEIFILDDVIFEIEKIAKRKTKEYVLAKLALEFVAKSNIKILKADEKDVDKSLISYSKQGYAIATHDIKLKNKLKRLNSKIMFIRQKKYVVIE